MFFFLMNCLERSSWLLAWKKIAPSHGVRAQPLHQRDCDNGSNIDKDRMLDLESADHAPDGLNDFEPNETKQDQSHNSRQHKQHADSVKDDDDALAFIQQQYWHEQEAAQQGRWITHQRARYYHNASRIWYQEAYVVAVHLDDGPDQPYYTIRYQPTSSVPPTQIVSSSSSSSSLPLEEAESASEQQSTWNNKEKQENSLNEKSRLLPASFQDKSSWKEKQTTADRLEYVPWDQERTLAILSQKTKPCY